MSEVKIPSGASEAGQHDTCSKLESSNNKKASEIVVRMEDTMKTSDPHKIKITLSNALTPNSITIRYKASSPISLSISLPSQYLHRTSGLPTNPKGVHRGNTVFCMNMGSSIACGEFCGENTAFIEGDHGFSAENPRAVSFDQNQETPCGIFASERYSENTLACKIPVSGAGPYTVYTYHAESYVREVGGRVFHININSTLRCPWVDVLKEVGMDKGLVKVFSGIRSVRGSINIVFAKAVSNPMVNAIKITTEDLPVGDGSTESF